MKDIIRVTIKALEAQMDKIEEILKSKVKENK
jgi:hypothetical protein